MIIFKIFFCQEILRSRDEVKKRSRKQKFAGTGNWELWPFVVLFLIFSMNSTFCDLLLGSGVVQGLVGVCIIVII